MKADQIAYYCSSREDADFLKSKLGVNNDSWIEDIVYAKSWVWNAKHSKKEHHNIALLQFNYQLGIELEIIRYLSGPNWHAARNEFYGNKIFLSHIGMHLDDEDDFPAAPGVLVQETWTYKHSSEFLTKGLGAGRTYHYRIYELAPACYIKYIKRVHPK